MANSEAVNGKACCKSQKDRISDLPKDVLGKILEILPLREAVRTCTLSKSWQFNWVTVSRLIFDQSFSDAVVSLKANPSASNYEILISRILLHHQGNIKEFSLNIPQCLQRSPDISPWIHHISSKGVKRLSISENFSNPRIKVPSYLFWCSDLVILRLDRCSFDVPSSFCGLKHLVYFSGCSVTFLADSLGKFIARCPVLKTVDLDFCDGDFSFFGASNLKVFKTSGTFKSVHFGDPLNLTSPSMAVHYSVELAHQDRPCSVDCLSSLGKIEVLRLASDICKSLAAGDMGRQLPMTFNCMKKLTLEGVDFSDHVQFTFALGFIRSCPYIHELSLWSRYSVKPEVNFGHTWDANYQLLKLQSATLLSMSGLNSELKLVQLLLASSPKLKTFSVNGRKTIGSDAKTSMLIKLMEFPRASPAAMLYYTDSIF